MKNKTTAGLLAIFGGAIGLHRFYLGQTGLGIGYIALFWVLGLSVLLGLIDGIAILGMSEEQFDRKYNKQLAPQRRRPNNTKYTNRKSAPNRAPQKTIRRKNPYFETGMKKFGDYDLKGAIVDFEKALEINPRDYRTHFRLASCYSLQENIEKAYYHLSKSVETGFKDFKKIQSTDELAFLRIDDGFEEFADRGYKLERSIEVKEETPLDEDLLLSQLNKLRELREKGILSEEEFLQEKRKLQAR